ncbi:MAG: hypothetical protein ABGW69_02565 [Nanoarchaeota archaeon]
MAILVEVMRPVTAGGRSMAKYVYGALKGKNVPDDVIKRVIKTLNKWAIKYDLEEKEVTFDLELSDDYSKIIIKNVKIWEPTQSLEETYEMEVQ